MRRKKLPSRKRQALWRVLLALVSLLLVDHIFGIALLPIQAVRREAEHEGIGRAWVVERKWEPSLYKTHLFYLMENERAVMLGDTHLSPLGWETMFGATVDCTGEEPYMRAIIRSAMMTRYWAAILDRSMTPQSRQW